MTEPTRDEVNRVLAIWFYQPEYGFSLHRGNGERTWFPNKKASDFPTETQEYGIEGWLMPNDDRTRMPPSKSLPWQVAEFDPFGNVEQAFQVLEKVDAKRKGIHWIYPTAQRMFRDPNAWSCIIVISGNNYFEKYADTPAEAISRAVYAAIAKEGS